MLTQENLDKILKETPDAFDRYPFLYDFIPETEIDYPDLDDAFFDKIED